MDGAERRTRAPTFSHDACRASTIGVAPGNRDRKSCARCLAEKSIEVFPRLADGRAHSWCRMCRNRVEREYARSPAYRERIAAHRADPEVRRRKREADRKNAALHEADRRAYRATARARVLHARRQARIRLRRATKPNSIARIRATLAAYDREIARMDRDLRCEKKRGPKPGPRAKESRPCRP